MSISHRCHPVFFSVFLLFLSRGSNELSSTRSSRFYDNLRFAKANAGKDSGPIETGSSAGCGMGRVETWTGNIMSDIKELSQSVTGKPRRGSPSVLQVEEHKTIRNGAPFSRVSRDGKRERKREGGRWGAERRRHWEHLAFRGDRYLNDRV